MKGITVEEAAQKLLIEMRRGDLVLAALTLLEKPDYGYGLLKRLTESGIEVSQDTLYPLLRRLEAQGFIEAEWDTHGNRPRKNYRLKNESLRVRKELITQWKKQKQAMEDILWK